MDRYTGQIAMTKTTSAAVTVEDRTRRPLGDAVALSGTVWGGKRQVDFVINRGRLQIMRDEPVEIEQHLSIGKQDRKRHHWQGA